MSSGVANVLSGTLSPKCVGNVKSNHNWDAYGLRSWFHNSTSPKYKYPVAACPQSCQALYQWRVGRWLKKMMHLLTSDSGLPNGHCFFSVYEIYFRPLRARLHTSLPKLSHLHFCVVMLGPLSPISHSYHSGLCHALGFPDLWTVLSTDLPTHTDRGRELILKWWILSQGGISALSYRLAKWDLYPLLTHLLEETLCHQTLNMIPGSWVLWTCFKHSPANGFAPGSPASLSEHLFPFSCLVSSPAGAAFCLPCWVAHLFLCILRIP